MNKKNFLTLILACGFMGIASTGHAVLAPISTTLTGDIRYSDLNDLKVDVDISFDIRDDSLSNWKVDLAPLTNGTDPGAKLLGFWFNLGKFSPDLFGLGADQITIDNLVFNSISTGWGLTASSGNASGSGNAQFLFEVNDPNNKGAVPLEFTLGLQKIDADFGIKTPADWKTTMFSNALASTGDAGTGQLGAHVGGLRNGCSGFVMGNYDGTGNSGTAPNNLKTCGSTDVPEPGSLALIGLGLLGLYGVSRRKA